MKRKIFSVFLALVLALSFSLVTAVPVAANVTEAAVTVDPATAGAPDAEYTILFNVGPSGNLTANVDTITIVFPVDTVVDETLGEITGTVDGTAFTGYTANTSARTVVIITPVDVADGGAVTVVLETGITNPTTEGTPTLEVATSVEPIAVPSAAYTITPSTVTEAAVTVVPATAGAPSANYTIVFNVGDVGALTAGDNITIVFPEDTVVEAITGEVNGTAIETADNVTKTVVITVPAIDLVPDGGEVTVVLTAGITNPTTAAEYTLTVATSVETTAVTSATYTIAPSIVTEATVTVDPATAGAPSANYTIVFNVGDVGALTAGDNITIVFPVDTVVTELDIVGTVNAQGIVTATVAEQTVTITVPADAGVANGGEVTVVLDAGITNPTTPGTEYTLEVATSVETTQIPSAVYTITPRIVGEATVTAVAPAATAGADAAYTIDFAIGDEGALSVNVDTIIITFPIGTVVDEVITGTVNGIDFTGYTADNVTKTVVIITPVALADKAAVTVVLSTGITNPELADDYTLAVATSVDPTPVTSAAYTIDPDDAFSFAFNAIDAQVAGEAFEITITAYDQFDNEATGYTATANLTDLTKTISPATTGAFTAGVWTDNVTITLAQADNTITAFDDPITGDSGTFNVDPDDADNFAFDIIAAQRPGIAFEITITAFDAEGNVATSYTGTANLTDVTKTISPAITGAFVAGVWTDNVTITLEEASNTITATDTVDVTITGTSSGTFKVAYDTLVALKDGWTLFSTGNWTDADSSAWVGEPGVVWGHDGEIFVLVTTFEPLEPVEALYVNMPGGGSVGLNYSDVYPAPSAKNLVEGWNLVSSATSDFADSVFSPLRYVLIGGQQGVGLTTVVAQGNYNTGGTSFYLPALTETHWTDLAGQVLSPFDGYWVYMNATTTFSVIPD